MDYFQNILATRSRDDIEYLMRIAHMRQMSGTSGTWEQFIARGNDPEVSSYLARSSATLITFIMTLTREDKQALAFALHPCGDAIHNIIHEIQTVHFTSARKKKEYGYIQETLEHPEYIWDFLVSQVPQGYKDWAFTGTGRNYDMGNPFRRLAICCAMVSCEDGSEAPIRVVVARDRPNAIVLDEYVQLDASQTVSDYRTESTGITAEFLLGVNTRPVRDIRALLMQSICNDNTILVGHRLSTYLNALKLVHPKMIDTSLVFQYPEPREHLRPTLEDMLTLSLRALGNGLNRCVTEPFVVLSLIERLVRGKIEYEVAWQD